MSLKGEIMTKDEKQWVLDEEIRYIFLCDLALGSALVNSANGYVYLDNNCKQVKINIGKNRKNKDFEFTNVKYWRVATGFETFRIKSGLYRFWKVRF
jgi:hypothetical protein